MFQLQPIPTAFVSTLAFLAGLAVARALRGVRAGKWFPLLNAVMLLVFLGAALFAFSDDERFGLVELGAGTWLIAAVVLVATLAVNRIVLPFLGARLDRGAMAPGTVALVLIFMAGVAFLLLRDTALKGSAASSAFGAAFSLALLAIVVGVGASWRRKRAQGAGTR